MTMSLPKSEILTSPERRRRWSATEKLAMVAGTLRSTVVLRKGDWDQSGADYLMQMLIDVIEDDPGHHDKVRLAQERYRYAGEAR